VKDNYSPIGAASDDVLKQWFTWLIIILYYEVTPFKNYLFLPQLSLSRRIF